MIFSDVNNEQMMLGKSRLIIIALRRQKKSRKNLMTISLASALALPRILITVNVTTVNLLIGLTVFFLFSASKFISGL